MRAVLVRARAGMRGRGRTVLLLLLLLGLAGGVTLAAVAGSSRGRSALGRFVEASRPPTVEAFVNAELAPLEQRALLDDVSTTPGLDPLVTGATIVLALPGEGGFGTEGTDVLVGLALIDGPLLEEVDRPIVVEGRLPLRPGEVVVNEALAARRDLVAGDRLDVGLFRPPQLEQLGNGEVLAPAVVVDVVVAAVIRLPDDLARDPMAQPGTVFEVNDSHLTLHPSVWEEHGPDLAVYGIGLLAAPPEEAVDDVVEALQAGGGGEVFAFPVEAVQRGRQGPVQRAIELESDALLAFALVVGLLALGLLGGAIGRATAEDEADRASLAALGVDRRQLLAIHLLRTTAVAVTGALLAVLVAVLLSPLFPIGLGGRAEIDRGLQLDAAVLLTGGALLAVLLVARVWVGALVAARPDPTPSPTRTRLPAGLPPLPSVGVGMAVDGLRGRTGASLRAAMAGAVCGVGAVTAAATFGTSLTRIVEEPALQGWVWDVTVGNFSQAASADEARERLGRNPAVEAFAGYTPLLTEVEGLPVWFLQLEEHRGQVAPVVLAGRAPAAPDEIGLGRGTLASLGKSLGDEVAVDAGNGPQTFRVVAEVVAPAVLVPEADLETGGVMALESGTALVGGRAEDNVVNAFLVRLRGEGDERAAALADLRADFPDTVLGPMSSSGVRDLARVRSLPYLLAGLLGALAVGSVAAMLATVARRRRREVAVLRAVGARRVQVRVLVAAQASTFSLLALAVGLPLGVAAGRLLWRLVAEGLGSEAGPAVPAAALAFSVLALLLAVNAAAQVPATSVGRARPGPDLRSE